MSKYQYNLKKDQKDQRDYKFSKLMKKDVELPKSADLRSGYSQIKDQKELGACTGFSACSVMEYLLDKDVDLSELYLYYKERELDGAVNIDNGSTVRQSAKVATKIGTCKEEFFPYIINNFDNIPSVEADKDSVNHRAKAYYRLSSIDEIMYVVGILKKPILIGVDVYSSLVNVGKNGLIPLPDVDKEQLIGGHAINICGYYWNNKINKFSILQNLINFILHKKKKQYDGLYFILRNSWSKNFADDGYMYAPAEFIEKYSSDWWYLDI